MSEGGRRGETRDLPLDNVGMIAGGTSTRVSSGWIRRRRASWHSHLHFALGGLCFALSLVTSRGGSRLFRRSVHASHHPVQSTVSSCLKNEAPGYSPDCAFVDEVDAAHFPRRSQAEIPTDGHDRNTGHSHSHKSRLDKRDGLHNQSSEMSCSAKVDFRGWS